MQPLAAPDGPPVNVVVTRGEARSLGLAVGDTVFLGLQAALV